MPESPTGIIILNWNGLKDTRECLHSVLELNDPAPRVYVVDNGSTDGSVEELHREYGDRIALLANRRNLFFAGGNNVGIRRALEDGCRAILLLNNDTVVDRNLLAELEAVRSQVGDAILCPKIYYHDRPTVLWYAGGKLNLRRARIAHRGIRHEDRGQFDRQEETHWATGCALFATAPVFQKIGLLDEGFRLYCEDVDFCLRARDAGFKIVYVPSARVWHKVSASIGGNLSRRKLMRKWSGLRRLVKKHVPSPSARSLALLDFAFTEPIRVMVAGFRGKLS